MEFKTPPKLHKIYALIPEVLYSELCKTNIFTNFDGWVAEAIWEKLQRERNKNE
jgi:hypothetical protein